MEQLSNRIILTVDDEPAVRESIAAYFEDCDAIVWQASDGVEALEQVRTSPPDIVITDLRMPRMDGYELVRELRGMDDTLPVIVLSGAGMIHDAIEAVRRGAWDYHTKPLVEMEELAISVDRALERSRLIRENRRYQQNLEDLVATRTRELQKVITAVEQSANAVIMTDAAGNIEYVNPAFTEVTGFQRHEVMGKNPRFLKSGHQDEAFYANLWKTISSGKRWRGEFCNRAKDGHLFWELCSIAPIRDDEGRIVNYVAIKEEITERKRLEEQLYFQANFDPLTGIPNRHYFTRFLQAQLEELEVTGTYLTLLVVDVDNLKVVNDTFGHDVGDILLIEVANRLEDAVGDDGVVARFMGDEFTIAPRSSSDPTFSVFLPDRVVETLKEPFDIAGTEVIVTASIGVVIYPHEGDTVDSLLRNAEAAMYQAKQNGKNGIFYYNRQLNEQLAERFRIQTRLHKALEREEFRLVYQPQIDLERGGVCGVEALLRWKPDNEGYTSPSLFIPLLEESSLILDVGEWVLVEACRQAVAWERKEGMTVRMSVNISALQFLRGNLDVLVDRALSRSGLPPDRLCLELTESMIMHVSDRMLERLNELRRIGVRLSLDDFGTGYSSLSYLGSLPITELKIDQTFVRRMLDTRNDAAVVSAIIAMAQNLGMELVAEGVETAEQLRFLMERGCREFQGFYFSPPLPPEQLTLFGKSFSLHAPLPAGEGSHEKGPSPGGRG